MKQGATNQEKKGNKVHKKIDIYCKYENTLTYVCSTNQSKTCGEAISSYCSKHGKPVEFFRAYFAK